MTFSGRMRPAIGPSTLMCFCPASLVAAIFQPNRPLEVPSIAAWIAYPSARSQWRFEPFELGAGPPMAVQDARCGRYLIFIKHGRWYP